MHISSDIKTALKVGKRHGKPVVLILDTLKMYLDGVKFYISDNDVWLCDYVNPKYIKEVYYEKSK